MVLATSLFASSSSNDAEGFSFILIIIGLFGGLGMFLYGMEMMSDGMKMTAGNSMRAILKKLTSNRFIAVFVGAFITMIIQSSSATTVMLVRFFNSGPCPFTHLRAHETVSQLVFPLLPGKKKNHTSTCQTNALDS